MLPTLWSVLSLAALLLNVSLLRAVALVTASSPVRAGTQQGFWCEMEEGGGGEGRKEASRGQVGGPHPTQAPALTADSVVCAAKRPGVRVDGGVALPAQTSPAQEPETWVRPSASVGRRLEGVGRGTFARHKT